ncbi:hypothetical protein [Glycomyces xiaoerkulensis]|uniref:hypothetical protein n=1 Tax=Glycomyces xiaoerkulensis TaxID=2038139 RepID=UPI0012FFE224|nr:hypothetical protein [Glycomyces xiaoerkulensis]
MPKASPAVRAIGASAAPALAAGRGVLGGDAEPAADEARLIETREAVDRAQDMLEA